MEAASASKIPSNSWGQQTEAKKEVTSAKVSPKLLNNLAFKEWITYPLKTLFDLQGSSADVERVCQEKKLYDWRTANTAVSDIPLNSPKREFAIQAGMQSIFQTVQPNVMEMQRPPQAIVVPLGLHALNAVRIAALKEALEKLRQKFGYAALESMHIYFVGGRKLADQEKSAPLKDVMNFGLNTFCPADWKRLDEASQKAFLTNFETTSKQNLGDVKQLPTDAFGEADSAKHIWTDATGLNEFRELLREDRVHFIEAGSDDYKSEGRDSTHGNALLFLEHYRTNQRIQRGENSSVLICSDNICCPRASLIFEGYCVEFGIDVTPFPSALSGEDDQLKSLNHLLPLTLRESVCMLHELEKCKEKAKEGQNWFDTNPLKEKLNQLNIPY